MINHTNETNRGGEGVQNRDIVRITQGRQNKTSTNADCIKYLYIYEEIETKYIIEDARDPLLQKKFTGDIRFG